MNKKKSKLNIFLIILLVILITSVICFCGYFGWILGSDISSTLPNEISTANSANEQKNEEPKPIETKEDYIKTCSTYTFKEIARNPNNYKGKRAKFTGEVIQVQEGYNNNVVLRVNVTKGEYGIWEDTIWVDYKYANSNENKILEDDIITIYGEIQGQKSYTSILGSQVTLPQISANYIDIVE